MKRAWMLLLCTACATAKPVTPVVAPPAPAKAEATCPQARPDLLGDARDSVLGKRVDKVCLVGGSLELRDIVVGNEGQPLEAARVREALQQLFATGQVRDADAVATPVDDERVVLTWFITPYPRIASVRVEGARALASDEVLAALRADTFAYASPSTLRAFGEGVVAFYEQRGYPQAATQVAVAGDGAIVVTVSEGALDIIECIRFEGTRRVKPAQLRAGLASREGAIFVAAVVERDAMMVQDLYLDRGMLNAKVELRRQGGELVFVVSEGDVFMLGSLTLTGVALRDSATVLASLDSKKGAVFSRATVRRDVERIRDHAGQQGLSVNVTPLLELHPSKKTVDVTFDLK